jgi:RNA polymerase sigma-70 factor (ECF subfamily)
MSEEIARLYDAYAVGLYRYALMLLGDHALAEDAIQQVFSRIVAAGSSRIDQPDHYLRRAVRNECYTLLRRRRDDAVDDRPLLEPVDAASVDHDERLAIEAALRELPIDQREVLTLKVYEGLTFKEIAEVTETPLNTVASRYRYAIDKMRAALDARIK